MSIRKFGVDVAVTPGEELMQLYLHEHVLGVETWPQSKESNPEYFVICPTGNVLIEIKDFGEDELQRKAKSGERSAGAYSPVKRIARQVERSFQQLNQASAASPCMTVLYGTGTPYDYDLLVKDALYGRTVIRQMVGPEGALGEEWVGHDATITPDKKLVGIAVFTRDSAKHISAVAYLELVNPIGAMRRIYSAQFWEQHDPGGREELLSLIESLEAELVAEFGPDDEEFARLRIYHNQQASVPLPRTAFTGKHDLQTWVENGKLVSVGYVEPQYDSLSAFLEKRQNRNRQPGSADNK
jgi:hypothetical protein